MDKELTRSEMQAEIERSMEALPGRIILRFEPDEGMSEQNGIIVLRKDEKNKAIVVSVGDAIDDADVIYNKLIKPGDEVFAYRHYGKEFWMEIEGYEPFGEYRVFNNYEIFFRYPRKAK